MDLSIITINLNNAKGLWKTIESVAMQTSRNFEHIIIDGGSTDGSVEIIKSFTSIPSGKYVSKKTNNEYTADCEPHSLSQIAYWISEPDTGIFNAMNKGIHIAEGEYLHFLNSGDWLVDDRVVETMLKELDSNLSLIKGHRLSPEIFIGNVINVRPDGRRRYYKNNEEVSLLTFYRGTLQHTSAYIKKSLFDKYGLYDENLKIVSDWKWYLKVSGLNKANLQFTKTYVTCFDTSGISSTNLSLDLEERRNVLEDLIPAPVLADYDKYHFDIEQMERLKRYPLIFRLVWFVERCFFKLDKWKAKYYEWK